MKKFVLFAMIVCTLHGRADERATAPSVDRPTEPAETLANKTWNPIYDQWLSDAIRSQSAPSGDTLQGLSIAQNTWKILVRGEGPLGMPKDMERLCPKYASLTDSRRVEVWRRFFQAVAFAESGYDSSMVFHETWGGEEPEAYSVGLLQLSTSDNQHYGCGFTQSGRFAPRHAKENLECGVRILALQLAVCGTLFQGFENSSSCGGRTAHGSSPDHSFYFATLNPKDAAGPQAFGDFSAQWKRMTGWDLMTKTKSKSKGLGLQDCY
jgi:hypothetical protein